MAVKRLAMVAAVTAILTLIAAGGFIVYNRVAPPAPVPLTARAPAIDLTALKAKAEQGDVQAQVQLGTAFATGNAGRPDYKQAALWLGRAASNGNAEAETIFGELFQAGQGVPQSYTNAVEWYSKAAEQGDAGAQFNLGYLYEQGRGVKHDEKLAAHWYLLAAEGGNIEGQYDYGQRCALGVGVAKDPVEGLKWLVIAAANGQADSKIKAETLKTTLTGDQISEANRRAAAFRPRGAKS